MFTHDAEVAASRVSVDERGRYGAAESLAELHWA
jgi:hypothetical protein